MSKKLGRNDPCWCGSGKKYKKCHLNRHLQEPIPPWEAERHFRQSFDAKFCSCPDAMKDECSGNIVKAHTVSKSSSLKRIAHNNHVYGLIPSFRNLSENGGVLKPELIGVNRASTFTGFCRVHDNSLFSEFEDKPFSGSSEQCFLISYRSLAREFFTKKAQHGLQSFTKQLDKGRPELFQRAMQKFSNSQAVGVDTGFRDIQWHKNSYDKILVAGDFNKARAFIIEFEDILPFACSGGFLPEEDIFGKQLQDLMDLENVLDILCFSVFSSNNHTYAVFSWIDSCDSSCVPFVSAFQEITDDAKFAVLVQFACAQFENIFFSPIWWEELEHETKEMLKMQMAAGMNPLVKSDLSQIIDPKMFIGQFKVARCLDVNAPNRSFNPDAEKSGAG